MIEKELNIEKDEDFGKENRREDKREFEEVKKEKSRWKKQRNKR